MSVLRPVGPLPARAYWLRRGVLVVLVLVILFLASWAWGAATGGSDGDSPDGSAGPSASTSASGGPTPSPTESAQSSPSGSPSASTSPKPSASSSGATVASCAAGDISVVATPSKTTYTASQDPRFTIKVTNTSKQPCTRDVGQKAMELRVAQGDTLVWSSDHCAPGGSPKVVTLKAGASYSTSVVWSRSVSKKGCPTNQPDAAAGTYSLTGRNLAVSSKPEAFALA